jgi:hypothetical protein
LFLVVSDLAHQRHVNPLGAAQLRNASG